VELAPILHVVVGVDWRVSAWDAPSAAVWAFVGSLFVVASFGYYAPELVIGLCALGVFVASIYLAGTQLEISIGACVPIKNWLTVTIAGAVGPAGGSMLSLSRS